jgi:hypothetical protein
VSTDAYRDWMVARGRGLVRHVPLILTTDTAFVLDPVRRGNHPPLGVGQCADCHPVSGDGARHGISQYPATARGAACHSWLLPSGTTKGFRPAKGSEPVFSGSFRPHDLLSAAGDAHGRIYREGYTRTSGARIRVGRINAGCAGCHAVRNDKHGNLPGCLDCHDFGKSKGAVHKKHTDAVARGRASIDPGNAGRSGCDYCHGFSDGAAGMRNAACYSCHLDGHQVKDKDRKAHFWPL